MFPIESTPIAGAAMKRAKSHFRAVGKVEQSKPTARTAEPVQETLRLTCKLQKCPMKRT